MAQLQPRLRFNDAHANTLEEGAPKLVGADITTEAANLLALFD